MARPAYLVLLPKGLIVSGITTWALHMCASLAGAGRQVGIAVHAPPTGHTALDTPIPPGVRLFDLRDTPDMERCAGNLAAFIPAYAAAARTLALAARAPVVVTPYYLGDCFGAAAALTQSDPSAVRLLAVQQLMIPYESRVLAHYEPAITRFVGVSREITAALRAGLPHRPGDVRCIPNAAPVPAVPPPARPPLVSRPLRLIYTGRIEQPQKRVSALVALSRELTRRAIDHRLMLVGDGPAQDEIDALLSDPALLGRVERRAPVPPEHVARLLDDNDIFVLASRAEGLSLSLVEAMARACVPVIARTPSGAAETVVTGRSGWLAEVPNDAGDEVVATCMADAIGAAVNAGLERLAHGAWQAARESFSTERAGEQLADVIDECAAAPARSWPAARPVAFTSTQATEGSGAVPPDGASRLRQLLVRLAGRRTVIHGTGRHTLELGEVLAESPAPIVAFTDDDPARRARSLWNWPVIAPSDAARTGATDVVISSWMNQDAIWARRSLYERQGLTVHRLYAD